MSAESFFRRRAKALMRRPVKPCLEANRLEDRVVPAISGFAFQDFNANGAFDTSATVKNLGGTNLNNPPDPGTVATAIDVGLAGVTVRVFNAAGALIDTQVTAANGSWTSNATAPGQQYRVEYSGLASGYVYGPHGSSSGTATQFVTDGTSTANLSVVRAADYYPNIPLLVTPIYTFGGQDSDAEAIVSFPYNAGSAAPLASSQDANNPRANANSPQFHDLSISARQVGTTWGLAYNRPQSTIYASAFTKRHSNWAPTTANNPGGPGMIYRMGLPTQATGTTPSVTTASPWVNLQGLTALLDGVTPITINVTAGFEAWATNRQTQTSQFYWERDGDDTGWDAVGKTSFGGLDVSDDGSVVYVMSLADRRLYAIPVLANGAADTANIRAFSLPNVAGVANQDDIRPFAVEFHEGLVYIGLVNSAESTVTGANPDGDETQLRGYVYTFDPTTNTFSATSVVTDGTGNGFSLNYPRGTSYGGSDNWAAWAPTFRSRQALGSGNDPVKWAQPMISGLTFDANNNIVISIRDRAGDQTGNAIPDQPGSDFLREGISVGDTLMAFNNVIGSTSAGWTLERNGSSPVAGNPATGATGNFPGFGVFYGVGSGEGPLADPSQPPSGTNKAGEFFGVDFYGANTHRETSLGSATRVPGFPDIVSTHFDPVVNGQFRTGGTRWFRSSDGAFVKGFELYQQDQGPNGISAPPGTLGSTFGKANGLGDLIAIAEPPPLEIGNRIFEDTNRNGVQDADEPGIAGVTVELWLPGGQTPLATAVTSKDGSYFFNSGPDPDPLNNPPHEVYGISKLAAGQKYEVRIPNASGGSQQAALAGLILTKFNVQTPAYKDDTEQDQRNSDAQLIGTTGVILVAANALGQSNHTYDAGFAPGVSLGDFVWEDVNNNGIVDAGEAGIDGIAVRLYVDANGDGIPDNPTPDFTTTTASGGKYLFDGLAPNKYIVEILSPAGFRSSTGNTFDPINGKYESLLTVNTNINDEDHGVTFSGDIFSGFIIRSKTLTLDVPGGANPDNGGNANLRQDFGLYRSYSLGNRVWNDKNNDGLYQATEPGIDGVTVSLFDTSAFDANGQFIPGKVALVANAVTANGGFYRFDNLVAGKYVVVVQGKTGPLANFVSSTGGTSKTTTFEPPLASIPAASKLDNRDEGSTGAGFLVRTGVITLGPGANAPTGETNLAPGVNPQGTLDDQADMTVDLGFYQPLSLGNQVWNDKNNNGVLDPGEAGIDGVSVSLFRADAGGKITGPVLETQTTKGGGYYLFTGLGTDGYIVQVNTATLPAGFWLSSTGKNGSVTGPFEPGVDPNLDQRDGIDRGTTDGTLVSSFAVALSPGSAPATPPTPGFDDNALPGDANRTIDFGFFQPVSLGNLVWNDANNNGQFDAKESGVDGIAVSLYFDSNGSGVFEPAFDALVGTTTTKGGGLYLFQTLAPGGYFVEISAPGFTSSTGAPGQKTGPYEPGITDFIDNEDHGTNAGAFIRSGLVTLAVGGNPVAPPIFNDPTPDGSRNYTIDFGIFQSLSVGNLVWNDINNNGLFDSATEKGVGGVLVELLSGTTVIRSTITDADGGYLFTDLSAGDFSVRITAPAGFISSTGKNGSLTGPFEPGVSGNQDNQDHGTTAGAFITTAVFTLFPAGDPTNPDGAGSANLRQDFGIFQPLALGDFVWVDTNNNGKLDAGETGLANVPVTLLDATGTTTIATTKTDANGNYIFNTLVAGTYIVSIAPGNGYISSTGANGSATGPYEPGVAGTQNNEDHGTQSGANIVATAVLTAPGTNPDSGGNANLRQDFGVFQPLSLGNLVWNDLNNNGKLDGAEKGVPGVSVQLLSGGLPLGTVTTDANGNYLFTNLAPGEYIVRIITPDRFATSTGKNGSALGPYEPGVTGTQDNEDHGTANGPAIDATVTLALPGSPDNPDDDGFANFRQDFGIFEPLRIGSFVWIDANDNGKFDVGEQPVAGVPVSLLDENTNIVATTKTDANGIYEFTNLIPGKYQVQIAPGAGVLPSSTSVDPLNSQNNENVGVAVGGVIVSIQVPLTLGGGLLVGGNTDPNAYLTFDFGLKALSKLSGYTYFDPNIDGKFTPGQNGDAPIGGVIITLTGVDANGDPLPTQTTTTDTTGFYQFIDLLPGTYTITETQPAGYYYNGFDTPGTLGGSSPATNVLTVTLGANQDGQQYNFGEIPAAYVMGYVWVDLDNDCQRDAGIEPGLANVPITLSGTAFAGTPLARPLTAADLPPGYALTVLTDATGYYAFPVLPPGNYTISRGDLPPEARNNFANSCLQNGDPNPNPPTAGNQQFTNVRLGVPVRGPFNFGVIPIDPTDPSKRNFLGSSGNTPNMPNPNMPMVGGPTRGPAPLNPAFTVTTGVPTGNALVIIGTGVGQRAVVRVFDYAVGGEKYRFEPYGAYTGGVRVAQGDVDGDGINDIITATGQGGGPRIRVYSGATGLTIRDFFAYEDTFRGGVFVAAADIDGDGKAEIITGTELGGGPRVRVFNGATGKVMQDFFAFDSGQRGGVRVAAADFNGDGKADIVATTGASVPTRVRVFNGQNLAVLQDFVPYGATFTGGANIAVGDVNGDGQADIVIGTEAGGGPRVQVFDGTNTKIIQDFFAFDSSLRSGVRVGARDINGDGLAEIIVTAGNTGAARVRMLRTPDFAALEDFFALDPEFRGGAYVG